MAVRVLPECVCLRAGNLDARAATEVRDVEAICGCRCWQTDGASQAARICLGRRARAGREGGKRVENLAQILRFGRRDAKGLLGGPFPLFTGLQCAFCLGFVMLPELQMEVLGGCNFRVKSP